MENNLAIVLVAPQGPANIGAAARAMKNFGISDLRLVTPCDHLSDEARRWAVAASDLLESAKIFPTLDAALMDIAFSAAFTRRFGKGRKRRMSVAEAAPVLAARASDGGAALVFGPEESGLANEHIERCDATVEIPSSAALPSLNLAQSVLVACYEMSRMIPPASSDPDPRMQESYLPRERISELMTEAELALAALGYDDEEPWQLRSRIRERLERIFGRAGLTERDAGMIEGLLSRISGCMK
ncbi:MAG: RNA methyltransferase [Proteobacteria bacterium]|nr:RNA methyltransferase [Pseudomonadota bacterium]